MVYRRRNYRRTYSRRPYVSRRRSIRSRRRSTTRYAATNRRPAMIAKVNTTSDAKTIKLTRTYSLVYNNVSAEGSNLWTSIDVVVDPNRSLVISPYWTQYKQQYSYCLPMSFTMEFVPCYTELFPIAGANSALSIGPLEFTQTSTETAPGGYLQLPQSTMVLPERNMIRKFKKVFKYQRQQMEYTTDQITETSKLFGFLQCFQYVNYGNESFPLLPAASLAGMIKITHTIKFWEQRTKGQGPMGNPYTCFTPINPSNQNIFDSTNSPFVAATNPFSLDSYSVHESYLDHFFDNFIPMDICPVQYVDHWVKVRDRMRKAFKNNKKVITSPSGMLNEEFQKL